MSNRNVAESLIGTTLLNLCLSFRRLSDPIATAEFEDSTQSTAAEFPSLTISFFPDLLYLT